MLLKLLILSVGLCQLINLDQNKSGLQVKSAVNTIGNVILARKARTDYNLLKTQASPNTTYYMRKKEAILTGSPKILRKRGRKPKY